MNNLSQFRKEYSGNPVDIDRMSADPFIQFDTWFNDAVQAGINEPNAMTLATADAQGAPSCRVVLLKEFSPAGFTFFTNYLSRKGCEIETTPQVALLFFWAGQQRQIRICGNAEKISEQDSEAYFDSRPLRSRVAAVISLQSSVIASREDLDKNFEDALVKYEVSGIRRPQHWGGYRVAPSEFEFWQGRADRLHDRIGYRLYGGVWKKSLLSP